MSLIHSQEETDRITRRKELEKKYGTVYPASLPSKPTHIGDVLANFENLETAKKQIVIAGRVRSRRTHGSVSFVDLEDASGKIQIYVKQGVIPDEELREINELIDIGDFLHVSGICEKTRRGEKSLLASHYTPIAKALLPLPEKWHGLQDVETRFRKRELDLLANAETKKIFLLRDSPVASLRDFLRNKKFIEVETPILQSIPGGATAEPFVTHHRALGQDMYLRVAPELFLKRLIVGGFERVFEIARCFRNEGVDTQHNPEFTQVELYMAYENYATLMTFAEKMLSWIFTKSGISSNLTYAGERISFEFPLQKISFADLFKKYLKETIEDLTDLTTLQNLAKKHSVAFDPSWKSGKLLDEIYKKTIRPQLIQPQFITGHPIDISPLAKRSQTNPGQVERFQLVVAGMEIMNAFSELNDPIDQERRFIEQEKLRTSGDAEAQRMDTQYIESLSYGMPPTAGLGMGIDRLLMLVTGTENIREVILFPTLRKKDSV